MPKMSPKEIDAEAAHDKEVENGFFGTDDLMLQPGAAMTPEEDPQDAPAPEGNVLEDLDAIEKNLGEGGEEEQEAEKQGGDAAGEKEDESARTPEEDGEIGETDDEAEDNEEDKDDDGDEKVTVSKAALEELYGKYNAALKAGKEPDEAAQKAAQETKAEEKAIAEQQSAKQYAETLANAFEPVLLTEELADKIGITEHEAFNEFFAGVQKSLGAQALLSMSSQLPAMIINQTSQALPFILAAQQFIENNPEWENHGAIVEAALVEAKQANPNASPKELVAEMEKRINIAAKKGAAIAGRRPAKKHDTRAKKGQFRANGPARHSGGKKRNRGLTTDDAIRSMFDGSPGETDPDLAAL